MISGPSSFPPTLAEFLAHWAAVDAFLGAGNELMLIGGTERGNLVEQQEGLEVYRDAVTDAGVERSFAREQLNGLIATLQGRLVEFNRAVRAGLPGSAYERILPVAFAIGDKEETVRVALRQMSAVWAKVNAIAPAPPGFTVPLSLMGSYALAAFNADRETLRLRYVALTDADVDLRLARENRNDTQDVIYELLKNYRLKVPTKVPGDHALVASLPALNPPDGHTPAAVGAQAAWDVPTAKAKVNWDASADPDIVAYQVRGVPGDEYDANDEVLIATVLPDAPREVLTDFALNTPGITAGFKVYVILDTGREAGSVARFVTRPA